MPRLSFGRVALALACLSSGVAGADEIDALGGKVVELQAKIRELDVKLKPIATAPSAELAERRLIDAQVLYELKNYESASIILLDVVEKYKDSAAFPEALFFLADALFLKRDFFSSRRYFERCVELGPTAKRYQEALQRLIELSLYTGDYAPVDGYLLKLEGLTNAKQLPSVPYVKGKYYYFRQSYAKAEASFKDIGADHKYWFHSQYFVGAGQVAQGKLAEAVVTYTNILKVEAKTDSQKRIAELSHLAMARIYYDRGQLTNSATEYSKISIKSDLFTDSLYEQAWVSIKAKEFKKAFRALDLLLTAKPDDPLAPEVKLLIGNLHIRQNEYDEATKTFTKTREEFEPIKKQLDARAPADVQGYFRDMISKNLGKFDTATYLPPLAAKWVRAEPDMERVIGLVTDVGDLKRSLSEAEEIVARLEKALDGPQRINVFPELAKARTKVIELQNDLQDVKKKLLTAERELLAPVAAGERGQLDQLANERLRLEALLDKLPRDASSLEARQKVMRAQFDELDKRATELNVLIASYEAQRKAIEVYYRSTRDQQKIDDVQFRSELGEVAAIEEELRRQYTGVRREISEATQGIGANDLDMQEVQRLQSQLDAVMTQEHDVGGAVRGRLSGAPRTKVDQIESILERARQSEKGLITFNTRVEDAVTERLKDINVALAEEKAHVAEYKMMLGGYADDTVDVGAGVTADNFKAIAERFYQIVIRADVGIIDVSWALKQNKTDENSRLVREQKRELKLIDDEFKGVLKE